MSVVEVTLLQQIGQSRANLKQKKKNIVTWTQTEADVLKKASAS